MTLILVFPLAALPLLAMMPMHRLLEEVVPAIAVHNPIGSSPRLRFARLFSSMQKFDHTIGLDPAR